MRTHNVPLRGKFLSLVIVTGLAILLLLVTATVASARLGLTYAPGITPTKGIKMVRVQAPVERIRYVPRTPRVVKQKAPVIAAAPAPAPVVAQQVEEAAPANNVQALGKRLAAERGWGGAEWSALQTLWSKESGWNPNARNPRSGACGIPQRHPCNGLSSQSAEAQIRWGLDYIAGRYGSPSKAYAHFRARNWY